ncbi:methyltransferase family protein [Mycobacterium ulcerans]|uniref:methyltransferase family protein n=1 Tax=Mycobacterium ulcerans TaxID=1809 RepID=UPI00106CD2DB|nr:isoprenylcysteine carboxylmethyltransferase family protein [Mycobacterium ulcerans]
MKTVVRVALSSIVGLVAFGLIVFIPAGTFDYWQAWVFMAVFAVATLVPSIYLGRTNPAALQRRIHAGPRAESRGIQKVIITATFVALFAMVALSALDHRFGWSSVPTAVCLIGDLLIATGLGIAMLVVIQNGYAAATITVESDQKVVSTGLYSLVRHPMYVGNVILMLGIPLALGSYWGLVIVPPSVLVLAFRILDEESALVDQLDGYRDYMQQVRYRLLPRVW